MKNQSIRWRSPANSLRYDFRSKLYDGLLPFVALLLLGALVELGLRPVVWMWGEIVLLVLGLGLMAVAMFSLQRGLAQRMVEATRGWYGMAAGLLAWRVLDIAGLLSGAEKSSLGSILALVLAGLVVGQLWSAHLPTAGRFFFAILLAGWGGEHLLAFVQPFMLPVGELNLIYRVAGFLMLVAAAGALAWVFFRSERSLQRTWGGMWAALLVMASLIMLRGGVF